MPNNDTKYRWAEWTRLPAWEREITNLAPEDRERLLLGKPAFMARREHREHCLFIRRQQETWTDGDFEITIYKSTDPRHKVPWHITIHLDPCYIHPRLSVRSAEVTRASREELLDPKLIAELKRHALKSAIAHSIKELQRLDDYLERQLRIRSTLDKEPPHEDTD